MINFFKKIIKTPHFILLTTSNGSAALNFIANVLIIKNLTPEDAATFLSVAAVPPVVYAVFSFVPYKMTSTVVEGIVKTGEEGSKKTVSRLFDIHLVLTFSWTLLLLIFSVPISKFLQIDNGFLLSGLFVVLFFTAQINFIAGVLQGLEKYFFLGLKDILISFGKVLALILLFYISNYKTVWSPLFSEAIAIVCVLLLLALTFRRYLFHKMDRSIQRPHLFNQCVNFFSASWVEIGGVAIIAVVTSFDVLLTKHLLPATQAGIVIAASTYSKIVFFTSGAIPSVVYIFTAKYQALGQREKLRRAAISAFLLVFVIGGGVAGALEYGKEWLMGHMYGEHYVNAQAFTPYFLIYMLFTSLTVLMINFLMAKKWLVPLAFLLLTHVFFGAYMSLCSEITPLFLAQGYAAFSLLNILITAGFLVWRAKNRPFF